MVAPLLRVSGLSKTYNLGKGEELRVRALKDVSFEVREGEFVCVVGESGSGKSTLLHCLGSFEEPDPGCETAVQGIRNGRFENIWSDSRWYRQNFVGVVFQAFHLLPNLRVWQNVELPLKLAQSGAFEPSSGKRREMVDSALEQLGVVDKAQSRVNEISGGQCQRVAIARALVKRPSLILADEPTGNLDAKTTQMIVEELRRLTQSRLAVLMVTHNLSVARQYADRILTLSDGRIVAEESVDQSADHERSILRERRGIEAALPESRPRVAEEPESIGAGPSPSPPAADDLGPIDPGVHGQVAGRQGEVTEDEAVIVAEPGHGSGERAATTIVELTPPAVPPSILAGRPSGGHPSSLHALTENLRHYARRTSAFLAKLVGGVRTRLSSIRLPARDLRMTDLLKLAARDARESYTSLVTNIIAILFGATMSALLLALVFGAKHIMAVSLSAIPNIEAVNVWIDYGTGEQPITVEEFENLKKWPGAQAVVPEIKQLVYLYHGEPEDYLAVLASTEPGDPETARLSLVKGSRDADPEGWDVILTEQVAYELDHFDPHGLVGKEVTVEMRRYDTLAGPETATPSKVLRFPVRAIGIVKFSPGNRVYASLNLVRFARDFSTMRSEYVPEPRSKIGAAQISGRTLYEGAKVFFADPPAAEENFLAMRKELGKRFEINWPGEERLWLRDLQFIAFILSVGLGLLTVVLGSSGVFNTLLAAVIRKTREIGILRALGVSRLDVFLLFLLQSALIGLAAGIGALGVSYGLIPLANAAVGNIAREQWKLDVDLSSLLILPGQVGLVILVMVVIVCTLAASFPSWLAMRVTPMDAIRATGI